MKKQISETQMMRFRLLDVLRLVAALGVVLFHVAATNWGWTSKLFLMVDLFFVLSGFVLAPSFPKFKEISILRKFTLKRFLRLAPLSWTTIMFVLAYASLIVIKQNLIHNPTAPLMSIDFQSIVLSLLLLQVFSKDALVLNYPLWSLSAEWVINIFIAFLSCLFPRRIYQFLLVNLLLFGVIFTSSSFDFEWVNQICRAALGISVGILTRQIFDLRIKFKAHKLHLIFAWLLNLSVVFLNFDFGSYQAIFSCILFAYLIYTIAEFDIETNFRVPEAVARNCGFLSFGIYVWHAPLSGLVDRLLEVAQLNNLVFSYLSLVVFSSIATLVSVYFVERPLIQAIKGRLITE